MEAQTLTAEVRSLSGKGPARELRRNGKIPAVFYGPGKTPTKLSVSPEELTRALSSAYGRNQVIELAVGSQKELAIVRDLEIHPVSGVLLHADFYSVDQDRPIQTKVRFDVEGRALGVQKGGVLRKLFRVLPVRANPQDVPDRILVEAGPLDLGAIVMVKDLELPAGVTVTYPPERRVVLIEAKERRRGKDDDETSAEGESAS